MAYLRKAPNREGHIYYYIAQNYRLHGKARQRTLRRIGRHDQMLASGITDPGENARAIVAEYNRTDANHLISKTVATNTEVTTNLVKLGHQVLLETYNMLGVSIPTTKYASKHRFKFDLDKTMRLLVIGRILSPASKSNTISDFQQTLSGAWDISQNDMDRSLDHIPHLKESIELAMHERISALTNRTGYLAFYDVTNYYFETDLDDPDTLIDGSKTILNRTQQKQRGITPNQVAFHGLRKRGASKEYRHDPIVQLGLFMDSNGIPISYELFPGNQNDPLIYRPAVEQAKKQFGLDRIVTVADKAMNSISNIRSTYDEGDGWLFSQKIRGTTGVPKDIQNFVLDCDGWGYNESMTVAKKSMIRTRKLDSGKDGRLIREKVLVTWRESYAKREKIRRDGALEYASALKDPERFRSTMRKGGKKYLRVTLLDTNTGEEVSAHPYLDIDQGQVDFDAQFDGINVIVTSELNMSDEEMIATYGQLGKVEDCFRASKFNLHTRPVYVWTKEHIEAHFLICFVALTMLRFLQYRLDYDYSPARIIEALKSIVGQNWAQGYWEVFRNDDAGKILKRFGYDLNRRYIQAEVVTNLGKRLDI